MQRSAEASWDLQAGRGKQMANAMLGRGKLGLTAGRGKQMPNATLGRGKLGLTGRQGQAGAYN